jgi:hypothetical protein
MSSTPDGDRTRKPHLERVVTLPFVHRSMSATPQRPDSEQQPDFTGR